MSAIDPPPPDWFASKKFAYPAAADARGWYGELQRINGLFWKDREEWRDTIPEIDEYVPAFICPQPVEAIDRDEALAISMTWRSRRSLCGFGSERRTP